ncbi:hypothetical protein Glove_137g153 [Diversispora epigaea]|uniref:Uncharacterized protein n=1 Tax=Diversispora epigaea TaxID=1348612 RepID=A0A397J5K1_9GLOM|nr:hypothetical protein Glove_137g153 [Diversispora epigaea]
MKHIEYGKNTLINIKKLLRFLSDPHMLPSQTILDLIVNNPLGKSILTEALNQHSFELKKDIEQRFRLTNIRELATDRTPLLSFMFYTGALTHKPGSLKFELQILNHIAKREFITEALKIYDRKEEDLIENSTQAIERQFVIYSNEKVLKQAFMDALILSLQTDVEQEFQVHSQSPDPYGKAIDLVKTNLIISRLRKLNWMELKVVEKTEN